MNRQQGSTAFILAGGKSSRMGTDKGLMLFHGKEMIVAVIDFLKLHFKDIRIVTGNPTYLKFNLPLISDIFESQGPLSGIYSGLNQSNSNWNFFVACDMPFITSEVVDLLSPGTFEGNALVPYHNNFPEPLCAFYHKSCSEVFKSQLTDGKNKIQDSFALLEIKKIDVTSLVNSEHNPFRNLNTPDELAKATQS